VLVLLAHGSHTWMALHLAAGGFPLAVTDGLIGKLPRPHVLLLYPTTIAMLLVTADHLGWETLAYSFEGALALWALFSVAGFFGVIGAGDVRLAPIIGAHLGQSGILILVAGTTIAFFLGGLVAIALLVTQRLPPDHRIPFGPVLIAAAVLTLAF
jgi:leader peptidase (prepilin peptidase) / N-methyltransferase